MSAPVAKGVKNVYGPDTIYRIHPAFGIARVGSSTTDFFIGPEIPGQGPTGADAGVGTAAPPYKDGAGKIKRQAARFRLWRYEWSEKRGAYEPKGEVNADTPGIKSIKWTVEVANRKASFFRFDGGNGEQSPYNSRATFDATKRNVAKGTTLDIGPFKDDVSGKSAAHKKLQGGSLPIKYLGEILTDAKGRLIVLGGMGAAEPTNAPAAAIKLNSDPGTDYANNDEWIDDVSDGPVTAEIEKTDTTKVLAEDIGEAWVAVAPPDFAPPISSIITLYDTLTNVAVQHLPEFPKEHAIYKEYSPGHGLQRLSWLQQDFQKATGLLGSYKASFQQEIEPFLRRLSNHQWVFNPVATPGSPRPFKDHSSDGVYGVIFRNSTARTTTTGGPPYSTGVKASVLWDDGFAYFLKGDQYIKYSLNPKKIEAGYPKPINGQWAGLPTAPLDFTRDIDAIVTWDNGHAYILKGDSYIEFEMGVAQKASGVPTKIKDGWKGPDGTTASWPASFAAGIDAAVNWDDKVAYLFKGSECLRYDMKLDRAVAGYPKPIGADWDNLPTSYQSGIDSAVLWNNGKAYFFKADSYIQVDVAKRRMDPGYPRPIKGNWPGFPQPASDDQPQSQRGFIVSALRTPYGMTRPAGLTGNANMPKLRGDEDLIPGDVKERLALTRVQFALMVQWWKGIFESTSAVPPADISPEGLDRAALENCVGGAFFPGIEVSWLVRNPKLYREPFRVDRWEREANGKIKKVGGNPVVKKIRYGHGPGKEDLEVKAGYFSQQMAVPWQSDFLACYRWEEEGRPPPPPPDLTIGWWPAQRPDDVYKTHADAVAGNPVRWDRHGGGQLANPEQLISNFDSRGFVVKVGDDYLEQGGE